jgi:PAS domain S-box-containing protein
MKKQITLFFNADCNRKGEVNLGYEFSEIVEIQKVQKLMNLFYKATGILSAVVDLEGNIITHFDWQPICLNFHRKNPITEKQCLESDSIIANQMSIGKKYSLYKCKNGLYDAAIPIFIEGKHVINILAGQFLIEKPDIAYFKKQAKEFGFNEKEYIEALLKVAVIPKKRLIPFLEYLAEFAEMLGEMGLKNIKRLESEKKLKESEERWKFALEGSREGVWDWNIQTNEILFSEKCYEILGYKRNIFKTIEHWNKRVHPEDQDWRWEERERHFKKEIPHYAVEYRIRCKDGSYKWILSRGKVVCWTSEGKPLRMVGTHTDINVRKNMENELKKHRENLEDLVNERTNELEKANSQLKEEIALRQKIYSDLQKSKERLKLALEGSGDGLWEQNIQTNEVFFDAEARKILGYEEHEEIAGIEKYSKNIHPEDFPRVKEAFKKCMTGQESIYEIEYRFKFKEDQYKWILSRGKIMTWDESGEPLRMLGTFSDISKRKEIEKAMKKIIAENENLLEKTLEAERLKTEFFSNISHEFRTPLNVILSSIQLLIMYKNKFELDNPDVNLGKQITMIKQNCFRLLRLVDNIIDMTRFESGFLQADLKNCNIIEVVEDIIMSVAPFSENNGIKISFDTEVEEKILACDADKMERIILNIISNAIKHTNSGGHIEVNIYDKEKTILIAIKDTGIGIPKEKFNLIFERFRQIDASLTRSHEGSGIGLSLAKALVELHKGRIWVESEYGKWCEFFIELPVILVDKEEEQTYKINNYEKGLVEKINIEFSDIYLKKSSSTKK